MVRIPAIEGDDSSSQFSVISKPPLYSFKFCVKVLNKDTEEVMTQHHEVILVSGSLGMD